MLPIKSFIELSRPRNVLITGLAVIVGGIMATWSIAGFASHLGLAAISASLIAAGGNSYNDYCDRELDRFQKALRPLPAGRISPKAALVWTSFCFIGGMILAGTISVIALLICITAMLLLIVYSRYLKGLPLAGNMVVALAAALAFIYGGAAVRSVRGVIWAAWLAFLFHLGREIIKDLEDREGDAAAGAKTLPAEYGVTAARRGITVVFLLLAMSLPLPYYLGGYQIGYLIAALIGVLPALVVTTTLAWIWSQPRQLHLLSSILKWDMLVGLLALYYGRPLPVWLA